MLPSRTATRAVARQLRPRNTQRQLRFATTNQQAAAAGGSSGLVGGLAGGGLVFLVGHLAFPASYLFILYPPHLFLTNIASGRLFLLSLLRRKVNCQCGLLHQTTTHLPHQIDPKLLTRTKRSAAMAQVHNHQLRGVHSRCQAVR
jgi:hypothetical protein